MTQLVLLKMKAHKSQFMTHSQLQNCYIQAFKASYPPQLTTARLNISHVRITLVRSYMNPSAIEENYSNQTTLIYSACRGMKTLSRRGGRGVRFWAFFPSTSLYSTHIFCNMQCNMYLNRKKQILTLDEVVQHTFIKQHVTVFAM